MRTVITLWAFYLTIAFGYDTKDLIDWGESRILGLVNNALSTGNSTCGPKDGTLNSLIDSITNGTGEITINVSFVAPIQIPTGNQISLKSITLSGLDTIVDANILAPYDHFYLNTSLGFSQLTLNVHGEATQKKRGTTSISSFNLEVQNDSIF